MPQEEIDRLLRRARARRAARRAAQGRRPVRVRPRRRGGARAARGRHPVRGRAGRDRGRRRARLRRHPGHAPRAGVAASRSSPATRTRPSPRPRSTGPRSPRFPGTLVFYMGVRALPRIAERLIAGGRAARRAGRGRRARHAARASARVARARSRDVAERAARAASARRRSRSSAPVAALREQLAWLEARPLHGRTVAVTRARAQASALAARLRELGADGGRGAGDPHRSRCDGRRCRTSAAYDLVCVTSPERRRRCCSTACATPATLGRRCTVAAIGPGTARALRAHGIERRRRARARRRRGARRGARGRAGRARAGRPRAPRAATCCPTRCASAAPRSTCVALYETVAEPLDDATRARPRRRRLRAVHLGLDGALLRRARAASLRRPAAGLDRPGHQRRAARARRRARPRGRPAHARRPGRRAARRDAAR